MCVIIKLYSQLCIFCDVIFYQSLVVGEINWLISISLSTTQCIHLKSHEVVDFTQLHWVAWTRKKPTSFQLVWYYKNCNTKNIDWRHKILIKMEIICVALFIRSMQNEQKRNEFFCIVFIFSRPIYNSLVVFEVSPLNHRFRLSKLKI